MKVQAKKTTNLVVGAMIVVVALAAAFWMLLLSPKREEAQKLGGQVETLEASLSQHRSEAAAATQAKRQFPRDYARLVVLGKAVPSDAETSSLLVQLNHLANRAGARFETLTLNAGAEAAPTEGTLSPTEGAGALPLGASTGPGGLAVMAYSLTFEGDFFQIASFIESLDALVETTNKGVDVSGRLVTIGSFSLTPAETEEGGGGGGKLQADLTVTTYLTPPGESLTAGAPLEGSEEVTSMTSTTTGTAP